MSKEALKKLIDLIDEKDIETVYTLLMRYISEDEAMPDEIEALAQAEESIAKYGTISHDAINWN